MNTFIGINSDPKYQGKIVEIMSSAEIPERWRGTPIEHFIQAQNFGYPLHPRPTPQVLIVSCMEFRYSLPVPANYAYVIRTPGGRLVGSELALGYVLYKGVSNILLIAHSDCGMAHLHEHSAGITQALISQGWETEKAREYVKVEIERQGVKDELDALEQEYHRLKKLFNSVHIAPLFLTLSDKRVYIPMWYKQLIAQA
jgi:carbonic anhydrase